MSLIANTYTFNFYRFIGVEGNRTTEIVRDYSQADGMRGIVERSEQQIQSATQRVIEWATEKGLGVTLREPFPSQKYPGKVWLEFRFTGLTL